MQGSWILVPLQVSSFPCVPRPHLGLGCCCFSSSHTPSCPRILPVGSSPGWLLPHSETRCLSEPVSVPCFFHNTWHTVICFFGLLLHWGVGSKFCSLNCTRGEEGGLTLALSTGWMKIFSMTVINLSYLHLIPGRLFSSLRCSQSVHSTVNTHS